MNRTIAVTGSASGIGATLAALLTERGDTVIGVDLADADVVADLASPEGRAAAVRAIAEKADGRLDGLVTCAGTSVPGPAMVRVNYFGSTELAAGLQPLLAASPAGRVVLIGSISGTQPAYEPLVEALLADDEQQSLERADEVVAAGGPQQIYPSTKSALAQWARRTCVAPGWADAGIPVNVVAPGVVLTPMTTALVADPQMKQVMDAAVPMPLNGYAPPEAPAALAAWLVGAENTHVTGQVVYVDGGAEATLRAADHF